MNKLLKTFKVIFEILIILWVMVSLKRMKKFRWIYFLALWIVSLLFALFPSAFIHVLIPGVKSLGNVLTLPWTFYALYIPFTLIVYKLIDSIVNMVLIEINEPENTINLWRDVILGFIGVIAIAYFATGGIGKMKEADENYRRNVNGQNLHFKN